jgi:Polyketide cyclase / dehydrase and lipid transport
MIYIIILGLVAAFLFWVWRKPDGFIIQREVSINAMPQDIFGRINNLRHFNEWNPWADMDPTSTMTYNTIESGPGASYSWIGKKTGEGSMTVLDQKQPSEVNMSVNFLKPFKANNKATFRITSSGGNTTVNWAMTGKNAFAHKLMQTFFSMDKMVGKEFERGLATLKQHVEQKKVN